MKILRIGLNNLNSLRGLHEVDLEAEPLGSSGIFAITGQTGAGKSTLLDAITLALYGRAARYGESPNPEDMMSRHTGECSAEIDFEVAKGRFRAAWQLRRARGNPEGNLQPARRYLYDADGKVLAERIGDVSRLVEDLCGLDYNRFTRSVLLAQGEFAKFLKAKPDERAELLESLTRTAVYSSLGLLLHEEFGRREGALRQAEQRQSEMSILDPDELEAKTMERRTLETAWTEIRQKRSELAEQVAEAKQLRVCLEKHQQLRREQSTLEQELKEATPQLKRLTRHQTAQPFFPALAQFEQAEQRSKVQSEQVEESRRRLDGATQRWIITLHGVAAFVDQQLIETREARESAKVGSAQCEALRKELSQWIETHAIDSELGKALPDLKVELSRLEGSRRNRAELEPDMAGMKLPGSLEEAKENLDQFLQGGDEKRRRQRLDHLLDRRARLASLQQRAKMWEQFATRIRQLSDRMKVLEGQAKECRENLNGQQQIREGLVELQKAYRESLLKSQQIASLEAHRANLKPGEECPLCGALEHPFVQSQDSGSELSDLEEKLAETERKINVASSTFQSFQISLTKAEVELEQHRGNHTQSEVESKQLCQSIDEEAQKLGLSETDRGSLSDAFIASEDQIEAQTQELQELEDSRRIVTWMKAESEAAEATRVLEEMLKPFSTRVAEAGEEMEVWQRLEGRSERFRAQQDALRNAVDGWKQAQATENELTKKLANLQKASEPLQKRCLEVALPDHIELLRGDWQDLEMALVDLREREQEVETSAAGHQERSKNREAMVEDVESRGNLLVEKLAGSPFATLAELREARLSEADEATAQALKLRLDEARDRLKGSLDTVAEQIAKLRVANIPEGEAFEKVGTELNAVSQRFDELSEQLANLRELLKRDAKNRELSVRFARQLGEERAKLDTWRCLHELIGDSRGKKFRLYAQGISLDLLIRHANKHLSSLSERYQLVRRDGEELELQIEDRFQAGVTRPMASLSGGESFLASLALALGLSDLAGRNVRIDSLFIDEGFGSLDSDSLEIAISALEGLRQSHKTVGVISHVDVLKERVSTQINVEKQPNGTSRLVLR